MNFDEWLKGEVAKIRKIDAALQAEYGTIKEEYRRWLFEDAREPWGFVRSRQPSASDQGEHRQEQAKDHGEKKESTPAARPITEKQLALINKHMKGRLGPEIAAMIRKTGKPLEGLSTSEASAIIDFIMDGGK